MLPFNERNNVADKNYFFITGAFGLNLSKALSPIFW